MNGPDLALVLTAVGGLVTTVLASALAVWREVRAGRHETREVGKVVNGRHTAALRYNQQLTHLLIINGIPVPKDPSLSPAPLRDVDTPH